MNIVVVGMFDSIHFARWLSQFTQSQLSFTLVPSSPHRRMHRQLRNLLSEHPQVYRTGPAGKFLGIPFFILGKLGMRLVPSIYLWALIRKVRPGGIHAIELQHAGYQVEHCLRRFRLDSIKFMVTNYGSDIYWFSRFRSHRRKLLQLLTRADFYAAECHRDIGLARDLGFKGQVMPVIPNAGGFGELPSNSELKGMKRSSICVKGYQGWAGMAVTSLKAIESISPLLVDLKIEVFSANLSTIRFARSLARRTGLEIYCYPKGALTHDEMMKLFERSLIYVGLSKTDGISTSLLEAMSRGAIPVQSDTSCVDEWLAESGVIVTEVTAESVSAAISRALKLSSDARNLERNRFVIESRASRELVSAKARKFYDSFSSNTDSLR